MKSILHEEAKTPLVGDPQKLYAKCGLIKISIRKMIQTDLAEVSRIERDVYDGARYWTYEELFKSMTSPKHGCLVATSKYDQNDIWGYLIYESTRIATAPPIRGLPPKIVADVKNITVAKRIRRQGVGVNMLAEIVRSSKRVSAIVGEYSDDTIKFFSGCGFVCTKTVKDAYRIPASRGRAGKVFDGYRFEIGS